MQSFDYIFNVIGNFETKVKEMTNAADKFTKGIEESQKRTKSFIERLGDFELASEYVERLSNNFNQLSQSGITLDSQMHDLSAVAGVTGEGLKEIEGYARDSAKAFGTDAGVAVEGYKLLLSQLTPELAKCPEALSAMGNSIQVTSKLMGGDGVAAAQVLTTAMNQYGVSMDDPIAASKTMADMMNTMAAAGQAGSAELPAISAALAQCGMAAKASNVSFEETNAAIQVLDKAGKKASEGGVALRNTLAILGKGRFLPKGTAEELQKAGIDVEALADKNKTLKERLEILKPVLNDDALLSQLFGMENANAARALIQGTDQLGMFTDAVTGTNSAEEQANIVMDSYAEKQARVKQQIEDVKISLFNLTGGATMWISTMAEFMLPLAQMIPLFTGIGSAITWFQGIASIGFAGFRAAAVSACSTVTAAIGAIPIVGWIAIAIAALIALGTYFWNTSVTFRAVLKGLWAAFKTVFTAIGNLAKQLFGGIGDLIKAAFHLDASGISSALNKLKGGFSDYGKQVSSAFNSAYNAEMASEQKPKGNRRTVWKSVDGKVFQTKEQAVAHNNEIKNGGKPGQGNGLPGLRSPAAGTEDPTKGSKSGTSTGSGGDSGSKIRSVTITIDKLIDKFDIHTTNLQESSERVKDAVTQALMSALNDTNLAVD